MLSRVTCQGVDGIGTGYANEEDTFIAGLWTLYLVLMQRQNNSDFLNLALRKHLEYLRNFMVQVIRMFLKWQKTYLIFREYLNCSRGEKREGEGEREGEWGRGKE